MINVQRVKEADERQKDREEGSVQDGKQKTYEPSAYCARNAYITLAFKFSSVSELDTRFIYSHV